MAYAISRNDGNGKHGNGWYHPNAVAYLTFIRGGVCVLFVTV